MSKKIADVLIDVMAAAGARCCGIVGETMNQIAHSRAGDLDDAVRSC